MDEDIVTWLRTLEEYADRIADALERQAEAQELFALAISEANVVEGFHPASAAGVLYERIRARHQKGGAT